MNCTGDFASHFDHKPSRYGWSSTTKFKMEALWFKCFIEFPENLILGSFICADNESKIN